MATTSAPLESEIAASIAMNDSVKRKLSELETTDQTLDDEPYVKRSRPDDDILNGAIDVSQPAVRKPSQPSKKPKVQAYVDQDFGQRSALPGVHDQDGEVSDEDTNQALQYLRSVRSEAYSIPKLLVAPTPKVPEGTVDESIYNNGVGDMRGFYTDGAFIASRDVEPTSSSPDASTTFSNERDPQGAYHLRLLSHYTSLRKSVHGGSPQELIERLKRISNDSPKEPPNSWSEWHNAFMNECPTPTLLYQIPKSGVLRGLRQCTQSIKPSRNITPSQSCWIWSLLAKLEEVGSLQSEEVSVVRELGKRAASLSVSFRNKALGELDVLSDQNKSGDEDHIVDWEVDTGVEKDSESDGVDEELDKEANALDAALPAFYDGADTQSIKNSIEQPSDNLQSSHPGTKSYSNCRRRNTSSPPSSRSPSPPPVTRKLLSRAEAELERQLLREQGLKRVKYEEPSEGEIEEEEQEVCPDDNTKATVHMILTIVGECYGQRDLLEVRASWGE